MKKWNRRKEGKKKTTSASSGRIANRNPKYMSSSDECAIMNFPTPNRGSNVDSIDTEFKRLSKIFDKVNIATDTLGVVDGEPSEISIQERFSFLENSYARYFCL